MLEKDVTSDRVRDVLKIYHVSEFTNMYLQKDSVSLSLFDESWLFVHRGVRPRTAKDGDVQVHDVRLLNNQDAYIGDL